MVFRKVGIYWYIAKTDGLPVACALKKMLEAEGIRVVAEWEMARAAGWSDCGADDYSGCDMLIVLGGDGTILHALDGILAEDIPVLGVNLGRLGYLSEINQADLEKDIRQVLSGEYRIDVRGLMTAEGLDPLRYYALNEVMICRANPELRVLSMEISVNGVPMDRISGDGLIVATATGSTAYSLSAGGPIIRPGLDCLVITPVCSHTLNSRPVVVSAQDHVSIQITGSSVPARAVFDGRRVLELPPGGSGITVIPSEKHVRLIRVHDRNYFSLLREKLSEWTHS